MNIIYCGQISNKYSQMKFSYSLLSYSCPATTHLLELKRLFCCNMAMPFQFQRISSKALHIALAHDPEGTEGKICRRRGRGIPCDKKAIKKHACNKSEG